MKLSCTTVALREMRLWDQDQHQSLRLRSVHPASRHDRGFARSRDNHCLRKLSGVPVFLGVGCWGLGAGGRNSKPGTRNPKLWSPNSELRTPNFLNSFSALA